MKITDIQKKTVQAIVNIFETGTVLGEYGQVTLLNGDAGGLTYGRSQTTLMSGNLALLIRDYIEAGGTLTKELKDFGSALDLRKDYLNTHMIFRGLLQDAGNDPIMHQVQDGFFDRLFWKPTVKSAEYIGAVLPLSAAVIYDSKIQGAYYVIRELVNQKYGECRVIGENLWMKGYVSIRKKWLATHSNKLLHRTVYRMETFEQLISGAAWDLALPLVIRGVTVDERTLNSDYQPPVRVAAVDDNTYNRVLFLMKKFMQGNDVKELQEKLGIQADGIFGPKTDNAVREFQKRYGLKVDGKVGPATWSEIMD